MELTRRVLLQTAGAFSATIGLPSLAVAQRATGPAAYRFFSPDEAAFIEAAVDRLIPPEPDWPGARGAGVPNYIDLQLLGPYGEGARLFLGGPIKAGTPSQGYQFGLTPAQLYRTSLQAVLKQLQIAGVAFAGASGQEQDQFLTRLEAGEVDLDGIPSSVFFETLLANTIEGYFADPIYGGNRNMVGWRMVGFPGVYAAYLGVYTQHGISYRHEPMSMADAQRLHHHHASATAPSQQANP